MSEGAYLIKRGADARRGRAHAHIARYDRFGQISGAWCPATGFDLSSNVPWGLKVCRHCLNAIDRELGGQR